MKQVDVHEGRNAKSHQFFETKSMMLIITEILIRRIPKAPKIYLKYTRCRYPNQHVSV